MLNQSTERYIKETGRVHIEYASVGHKHTDHYVKWLEDQITTPNKIVMSNTRQERLMEWVNTLTQEKTKELLVICVDELIDLESIKFYDDTKVPYWDGDGEHIDGSEWIDEDEDGE